MRESALALTGMMSRGLEAAVLAMPKPYSGATLLYREHLVVESERRRIRKNLEREGIDVFAGIGSFVDAHTVQVKPPDGSEPRALKGEVILVATGTRPYRPPFIPFEAVEVYDSDEILAIETIPESMIVLGSGVIASEYACIFAALGVKVTMMDGRERLLEFLDQEMGDRFTAELSRLGLTLRLGDAPTSCAVDEKTRICTVGTKSGRTETARADHRRGKRRLEDAGRPGQEGPRRAHPRSERHRAHPRRSDGDDAGYDHRRIRRRGVQLSNPFGTLQVRGIRRPGGAATPLRL